MPSPATLDILARLVAHDTESSRSNLALIDEVAALLAAQGVPFVRLPNATGDKAAIYATVGPARDGGIVLSGHTDVVPVAGQSWTSDPFALRVADGRAYGRGAVDMKGFAAIVLGLLPEMTARPLRRPIHILLSYDEETTCLGVVDAIARMGVEAPRPGAVIVGEPTELQVADAHKSVYCMMTYVHGHEAHSSKPGLGANAVSGAAELVVELDRIGALFRDRGDPTGRFDPPYATVHVGTIHGGTARNILAKLCSFNWEVRGVPGTDEGEAVRLLHAYADAAMLPRLRATGWPARVETVVEIGVPGLAPEPGSAAETLALRLAGRNATVTVPYGTEAGRFQKQGLPTIVCGPGSIDQAHQPDEYITLDELDRGEAFIRRLIEDCR